MSGLLTGRRALVTGGGSGIGRATVRFLRAEGADVAVLDVDASAAAAVAAEVGGVAVVADVGDTDGFEAAAATAEASLGGLDILVNNAGVGDVKPFHRYRDGDYDRVLDANLRGTFHGIRMLAPRFVASGGGAIVNVASVSGMRPTRGEAPYAAAKAGVLALTQSAALEYGPSVRVNAVSPGLIDTPLTVALLGDAATRERLGGRVPLGRPGGADEVAAVIAFLCSDLASFVTGVNIPVDGGSLLPSCQVEDVLTGFVSMAEERYASHERGAAPEAPTT